MEYFDIDGREFLSIAEYKAGASLHAHESSIYELTNTTDINQDLNEDQFKIIRTEGKLTIEPENENISYTVLITNMTGQQVSAKQNLIGKNSFPTPKDHPLS